MAVLISKDKKDLIVNCKCGCDDSVHLKITGDEYDYAFMCFLNGNFYRDQESGVWRSWVRKVVKILCILRGKDYYYSDIVMSKKDFEEFKKYVNSIE